MPATLLSFAIILGNNNTTEYSCLYLIFYFLVYLVLLIWRFLNFLLKKDYKKKFVN